MLTMSEVELEDPVENIGGQLGRQTAAKTKDFTGDGTTTSVVLAQGPIAEGVKVVAAGANSALITRGIEKTTEALRPEFESKLKKDKSFSDVEVDLERYVVPLSYRYPSSSLKVKGMKSKHSIFGQRYVILKNPKGEEMIAEEEACCIHCSAKLAEGDELLKSVCDCTNAPVHLTCADTGTRKEGNICNYCEQEIHNEAVTLHRVITATLEINKENNKKGPFCSCLIM